MVNLKNNKGLDKYIDKIDEIVDIVPSNYRVYKSNEWVYFESMDITLPDQGWKIHLSCNYWDSIKLLDIISSKLFHLNLYWKIPSNSSFLEKLLYVDGNITSFGKFITIYPCSLDEFKEVIETLRHFTKDFKHAPKILTDKRYMDSKSVHYRYGAFKSIPFIDEFSGVINQGLFDNNGFLVKDDRVPNKYKPDWIDDPFGNEISIVKPNLFMEKKIKVIKVLHRTVKGGVYLISFGEKQRLGVLKEARKDVIRDRYARDATDRLKNEKEILERLHHLGVTPQIIDFFEFHESNFLITEYIEGLTLREYIHDYHSVNPLNLPIQKIKSLVENLINIVNNVHKLNISFRDLTPNNIMIDKNGKLKIIDFELAWEVNKEGEPFTGGTSGYIGYGIENSPSYDYYSLGAIIYFIACGYDPYYNKDHNIENYEERLIKNLVNNEEKSMLYLGELGLDIMKTKSLKSISTKLEKCFFIIPTHEPIKEKEDLLITKAEAYASYTFNKMDFSDDYFLFPSDALSKVFHEVNFNVGITGLMQFYNELYRITNKKIYINYNLEIYKWIKKNKPFTSKLSNSLYFGYGSLPWILIDLSKLLNNKEIMREAIEIGKEVLSHNTINTNISHGKAGLGLLALHLYKSTNDLFFIRKAKQLGNEIINEAKIKDGLIVLPTYKSKDNLEHFFGYSHGIAGAGYFLLNLYIETPDEVFKDFTLKIIETLDKSKIKDPTGAIYWYPSLEKKTLSLITSWCNGVTGIGKFLSLAINNLDNATAESLYKGLNLTVRKNRLLLSNNQCHGVTSIGEFYLDGIYQQISQSNISSVKNVVNLLLENSYEVDGILQWSAEDNESFSYAFMDGSTGIYSFLIRTLYKCECPLSLNTFKNEE